MIPIRLAQDSDWAAVCDSDPVARSDDFRREFLRRAVLDGQCLVAMDGDAVAAFGVLEYSFFGQGFVALLSVSPPYRRRGIGSAVLARLEQTCRAPKLFTSTNLSNLPMQRLLAKRGYVRSGVIHNLDARDPELIYFKRPRQEEASD